MIPLLAESAQHLLHLVQPRAFERGGYLEDGCFFFFCDSIRIFRGIKMLSQGISTSSVSQASSCGAFISIGLSSTRSFHGISKVESQLSGLSWFEGTVSVMTRSFHGRSIAPTDSSSVGSFSTVASASPSRSIRGVNDTS